MHASLETLSVEVDLCASGWERIVDKNPPIDIIARDIIFGEGPVWDARGKQLFFTDIIGDTIWSWKPGEGQRVVLTPSVKANGTCLDLEYRLVVERLATRCWLIAPALKAYILIFPHIL